MIKKNLTTFGITVYSFMNLQAHAQDTALLDSNAPEKLDPVQLFLHLDPGDIKNVSYDIRKSKWDNDGLSAATGTVTGTIEILEFGEEEFRAKWTTTSVTVNGTTLAETEGLSPEFFIGVPMTYTAQYDGAPLSLDNVDNIITTMVAKDGPFSNQPKKVRRKVQKLFSSMDKTTLAQLLLKIPSLTSLCHGTGLTPNIENSYDTQLPNGFGGDPFPAKGSYLLTSVDDENDRADIEWSQKIDPEKAKQLIFDILKEVDPKSTKDLAKNQELKGATFDISNNANCIVNISDGWVREMTYNKTVVFGTHRNSEDWVIRITPAAAAQAQ